MQKPVLAMLPLVGALACEQQPVGQTTEYRPALAETSH